MLRSITLIANFAALVTGLWLGLYVVTRSPRRLISWLTSLTLWSLCGHFLNVALALASPPTLQGVPAWLSPLLQWWQTNTLQGANSWLQGWLLVPAIIFWHHATTLMRFERLDRWHWARLALGYVGTGAAILLQAKTSLLLSASSAGDPLYLDALSAGVLFVPFVTLALLYTAVSLSNLWDLAHTAPSPMLQRQFFLLTAATLLVTLLAPLSIAGSTLDLKVPVITTSVLLGTGMVLLGYGVAHYSALMEGRTLRRDFYFAAASMALVASLYLAVTWTLVQGFGMPATMCVFVVLLAVVTHSLLDAARRGLDLSLYRRDMRQMQDNLQKLTRLTGKQDEADEYLAMTLESLCSSVRAIFGLLLLVEEQDVRLAAVYRWQQENPQLSRQDLEADDVVHLEPGRFAPPLTEAALLIPLYSNGQQLGALLLGRPVNAARYSPADVDQLLYHGDRLGDAIGDAHRKADYVTQMAQGIKAHKPATTRYPEQISVKAIEDALRNLTDYSHLGDHVLAQFKVVRSRIDTDVITHLDRGKAVYSVLAEAIEKLRPDDIPPQDPPAREWYAYLILYKAYLEGIPNRDIMSYLYISEGTFNRTRRAAVRAVTRVVEEMEANLN